MTVVAEFSKELCPGVSKEASGCPGYSKRVLLMLRIWAEWVSRLARHRIMAQSGPDIQLHLLIVEDVRRRLRRVWGGTGAMLSGLCRENGQTNDRRHHVLFEGDIYKVDNHFGILNPSSSSPSPTQQQQQHLVTTSTSSSAHFESNRIESIQSTHLQQITTHNHPKWSPTQAATPTATATPTPTAAPPP